MTVQLSQHTLTTPEGLPLSVDLRCRKGVPPRAALIVCHGFKGFKDWGFFPYACERLAVEGLAVAVFNFSHNGIGDHPMQFDRLDLFASDTYSIELADLDQVATWLRAESPLRESLGSAPLALLGHSRGAVPVMVRAAEDAAVRAVVTWNGVAHALRYSEEVLARWEEDGKLEFTNARTGQRMAVGWGFVSDAQAQAQRLDLARAAAAMPAAHLIVHGSADMAVDPGEAVVLQAGRAEPRCRRVVIDQATHTFGVVHPFAGSTPHLELALDLTGRWLAEHLPLSG
jgi:dienelactone hydrolase